MRHQQADPANHAGQAHGQGADQRGENDHPVTDFLHRHPKAVSLVVAKGQGVDGTPAKTQQHDRNRQHRGDPQQGVLIH
jgi:hypothetical protein